VWPDLGSKAPKITEKDYASLYGAFLFPDCCWSIELCLDPAGQDSAESGEKQRKRERWRWMDV